MRLGSDLQDLALTLIVKVITKAHLGELGSRRRVEGLVLAEQLPE